MSAYVNEPLDPDKHDRAAFSCGHEALDRYLKERANQEISKDIAKIYVLRRQEAPTTIVGYYSLSAYSVETMRLPEQVVKKLPRYNQLPAILLGRLALHVSYHGQKLGEILLADALSRSLRISGEIGAMAVLVDAKDERAARFYEHYGFCRFHDAPHSLFLTMAEIRKLGINKGSGSF